MNRWSVAGCASVLLLWAHLLAGCEEGCPTDCQIACRRLDACGLLPSPLGTNEENCRRRCENPGSSVRDAIIECIPGTSGTRMDPSCLNIGAAPRDDWCGGSMQPRICGEVAQCLTQLAPESALTGKATVQVLPEDRATPSCDDAAACGGGMSPALARQRCERDRQPGAGAFATLEIYLRVGGRYMSGEKDCVSTLTEGLIFEEVPPGLVRTSVVYRQADRAAVGRGTDAGAAPASGDEASACRVISLDGEVVVHAGQCQRISVQLWNPNQTGVACEQGAACGDAVDNDGDGRADCADPKCRDVCDAPPQASPTRDRESPPDGGNP